MNGQQQQQHGSGRRVSSSKGDQRVPNADKSNRLFSVLKGVGSPAPQLSQASVATSASDGAAAAGEPKTGGRKRNRSKSARSENDTKKAAVLVAEDNVKGEVLESGAMQVDGEEIERPSYLTDHEFRNLPISENTKRGLEKMKIRFEYI